MTLRGRLAVGLIAIAAILVAPLVIALRALSALHGSTERLQVEAVAGSMALRRVQSVVDDARLSEDALLFVHDEAIAARMRAIVADLIRAVDSLGAYGLRSQSNELRAGASALAAGADSVYGAAVAGRAVEAEQLADSRLGPALRRLDVAVHGAELALQARTNETVRLASDSAADARQAAGLALALALAAGLTVAILLARSISGPVAELERGMRTVAEGDFDHVLELKETRRDEFGQLAASFRAMTSQLSEFDRMKAEFVSIATHELKTPINVIIGYVQLLEDGIYGPLDSRQTDACRTVARQARALDRLVRRLLDVSRLEAGSVRLDLGAVNPAALAEDVHTDFSVMAEQRGIELAVEVAADAPPLVAWDADRLGEVLGNLVQNALNFTERGGRVVVAVDLGEEEDTVRLRVRDTGVGIDPEQLPRVFEKFYQARNQGSARVKGTGLGLAIVKEIVEAHGGTISAHSVLGRGTEFTIIMPRQAIGTRTDESEAPRRAEAMA